MILTTFLTELTDEIRHRAGDAAVVETGGDDLDYQIRVRPVADGPCPFTVHLESDNEVTIEFGVLSVAHFASDDRAAVAESCRSTVGDLLAGAVTESVWSKDGRPCRAEARLGAGPAAIKVSTRDGLCLRAVRRELDYPPYRA
jgi:hypothetical protein